MINREIILNKDTRKVVNGNLFELGIDGENLQENIIFKFEDEFVDGQARVEIELQNGNKSYITIEKQEESYVFPIKSVLTKKGLHQLELVITQGTDDEEIPIFKSEKISFLIKNAINAVEEAPEGYEQWLDVANTKLNQMDNLDIEAEQTISGATITITKKDGSIENVILTNGQNGTNGTDGFSPIANVTQGTESATISITDRNGTTTATVNDGARGLDGANGITPTIGNNGNWYLGETDTGKPSRGIQGETGATGSAGQDGISPVVTTSKSGNTTTITITDRTGEHTATIIDGVDGTNGTNGRDGYVQYTAGDNITIENNVISASGGSDVAGVYSIQTNSSSVPFVLDGKKQGVYFFTTDYNTNKFYYKTKDSASVTTKNSTQMLYIELYKDVNYDNLESNETFGRAFYISGGYAMKSYIKKTAIPVTGGASVCDLLTNGNQTISGTKTFNSIPQLALYTAPSNDTQLVAKKYVDDTIGNINTILATLTTPNS